MRYIHNHRIHLVVVEIKPAINSTFSQATTGVHAWKRPSKSFKRKKPHEIAGLEIGVLPKAPPALVFLSGTLGLRYRHASHPQHLIVGSRASKAVGIPSTVAIPCSQHISAPFISSSHGSQRLASNESACN